MEFAKKHEEFESIGEALHVLDLAAKRSGTEIGSLIKNDYKHLRKVFSELGEESRDAAKSVKQQSIEWLDDFKDKAGRKTKDALQTVNKSAQEQPWSYVAGAAAAAAISGFLLGRRF
jgi:ElaB/YqjD/DUF883 family membrane-anchored ribosome-binding protein